MHKLVVIKRNMGKYDDIIILPHHVSKNHPQMSNYNRAAQFAPFAALVGYEEAIEKSKIMLEKRIDFSEDKKREIEAILRKINARCHDIEIEYFILKDKNLNLGSYIKYKGKIKKIDEFEGKIFFLNRKSIYIKDIYDIRIIEDE